MSSGELAGSELRTFVAIELPDETRTEIAAVQRVLGDRLARAGVVRGLRWVAPESIHLTLRFLGATAADLVPAIVNELQAAADGSGELGDCLR